MGDNPLTNLIVSQEAPSEDDGVDLNASFVQREAAEKLNMLKS